jgi:hypothetical protein
VVIVVVVVVAKERWMTPAGNGAYPAETGARRMRAGVESGDMGSTLEGRLRCGQQIHLQLFRREAPRHHAAAGCRDAVFAAGPR